MRASNLASESMRSSEVGLVWEEKITNNTGTLEVEPMSTIRVRATGATTVTLDGILAMTMSAGEIAVFCAGRGDPIDARRTVTVVIAAAAAFVQVARNYDRKAP
jgi:hypothetical protein